VIKAELHDMDLMLESASDEQIQTATKMMKETYPTVTMITAADKTHYKKLREELENDCMKGNTS
jgi:hypothetical protein